MAPGLTSTVKDTNGSSGAVPVPRFLPPGVSVEKFQEFASQLLQTVGKENLQIISNETVLDDGDYLTVDCLTHDMHHLYEREEFVGSALIHPKNVTDIQAIVKLCNDFLVPVWTFSRGHNVGYGGAAPRVSGSLVMNLGTHLNRILEVNAEDCYCLVEPGVTYLQMQKYLNDNGLADKIWLDSPELGYGSMIGNALDHGVGFTPYGDHWMMHCGMEIVLANGEVVRTGMGAMQSPEGRAQAAKGVPPQDQHQNECWQLFPYGFGPINDGIFSQSNNGIITKMGMWLMPAAPGFTPFMVTYEKDEDLAAVVDIIRPLRVVSSRIFRPAQWGSLTNVSRIWFFRMLPVCVTLRSMLPTTIPAQSTRTQDLTFPSLRSSLMRQLRRSTWDGGSTSALLTDPSPFARHILKSQRGR